MVLKAAFDKLSAIVESTAKETGLSTDSIVLQWVSQHPKTKGAELDAADEYDHGGATVSQKPVRQTASSTNSIEKELREIICKRAGVSSSLQTAKYH